MPSQPHSSAYFNPRSGERSDDGAWPTRRAKIISIHAPANGATYYNSSALDGITISIHAPANGATVTQHIHLISNVISIHAPANGATLSANTFVFFRLFQSTLRRTERPPALRLSARIWLFQSTLRRTERPSSTVVNNGAVRISIHAPANGATHECDYSLNKLRFQSTLRRTERLTLITRRIVIIDFNPRSGERSDPRPTNATKAY